MKINLLIIPFLALFLSGCDNKANNDANVTKAASAQSQSASLEAPFELTLMDESKLKLQKFSDGFKVEGNDEAILFNFFATWCPPCRAEMPELNEFAKKHEGEVTFYAVNLQEPKDTVDKFLKDNGYTMPVLLDLKGEAADTYKVRAIPTTYVIDRDGKILLKKIGGTTAAELETALTRAAK